MAMLRFQCILPSVVWHVSFRAWNFQSQKENKIKFYLHKITQNPENLFSYF